MIVNVKFEFCSNSSYRIHTFTKLPVVSKIQDLVLAETIGHIFSQTFYIKNFGFFIYFMQNIHG